jgi:phosphatidate cytidylyltransferase
MISQNLLHRIMTGLPLAGVFIWFIFGAGETVFVAICLFIGFIGFYEYGNMLRVKGIPIQKPALYLSLLLMFLACWFLDSGKVQIASVIVILTLVLVAVFSLSKQGSKIITMGWYLIPSIWIAFPILLLYLLRFRLVPEKNSLLIFFVILVAAINDIFAYFGGKRFGRRLLAPTISPKKTIEGSIFGIMGGLIFGMIFSHIWLNDLLPLWKSAVIIIILVISSQAGDLLESSLKRYCGVKDSSRLIPGHGGLLDRIDAYLLALPVFVGLLYIFSIIA